MLGKFRGHNTYFFFCRWQVNRQPKPINEPASSHPNICSKKTRLSKACQVNGYGRSHNIQTLIGRAYSVEPGMPFPNPDLRIPRGFHIGIGPPLRLLPPLLVRRFRPGRSGCLGSRSQPKIHGVRRSHRTRHRRENNSAARRGLSRKRMLDSSISASWDGGLPW